MGLTEVVGELPPARERPGENTSRNCWLVMTSFLLEICDTTDDWFVKGQCLCALGVVTSHNQPLDPMDYSSGLQSMGSSTRTLEVGCRFLFQRSSHLGIEPVSPALQEDSLWLSHQKPWRFEEKIQKHLFTSFCYKI